MKKINFMELFGGVFIVFGVLSAFILIVIFDGSTDIMYLLGYFSIPLMLLAIGFILVSLSSGKVKNAIEKPVELPIQEHVMFLNTPQRILLTASAILIALMVLFPPTYYYAYDNLKGKTTVFSGYQFINRLETNTQSTQVHSIINREERVFASIYHIEPYRLSFQLFGLIIVTGFLLAAFHQKPVYKPS